MKSMAILRIGVGACLALVVCGAMFAQTTGIIRGSVKDPSGAVVPGANVTATLQGTQTERTATAGNDGDYEFAELPVGEYSIVVEAPGFKKFAVKSVEVSLGHVTLVNATLQVGEAAQTVTVESEATQVETSSTQLGAVMTDLAVRQLPLSTRDTYQLLQLQPGVQSQLGADLFYGSNQAGVVSVNGGRGRSNNYMVNGGDGNDIFVNLPAIQPSPDAIEQFRVLTNTFDAEFGRNSGSIVNVVTKSGTNDIHGDVFEFFRNDILNTRGYFDPTVFDYKQNQFGGTLGGPIKKDKTFIFGSYEGNRLRQGTPSGSVTLPTAAEANGDFSATGSPFVGTLTDANFASIMNSRSGCAAAVTAEGGAPIAAGTLFSAIFPNNKIPTQCFDPTALALYKLYVAPSGTGTISTVPVKPLRDDQSTIRVDHKISAAQQFSAYYYFDDQHRVEPFAFFQAAGANVPGFGSIFNTRVQQWNLSHTWTIGTSAVNEFRFNYFREGQKDLNHPVRINKIHDSCGSLVPASSCFADPTAPATAGITTNIPGREGVPFISVPGGFAIGNNSEGELPQIGNTFQWMDNYTKIIGKHTMKFGGDVRRQRFDQFLYFEINGGFSYTTFTNLCTAPNTPAGCISPSTNDVGFSSAYPDYFIGTPSSYLQGAAQAEDLRNSALYLFAQDSWKIKPTVTLNYGLRWELTTNYYDLGNRLQTFRPGQVTTQYPCFLSPANAAALGIPQNCNPSSSNPSPSVFPLGLVFPNDKGVQRGLTQTYYKSFAPRIGLAWSPGGTGGWFAKLTGGPGKSSVRMGWGIFYNPIEQLVLEQFSAEPPFGVSVANSNVLFNLPFEFQSGGFAPNASGGVININPKTPCPSVGGPAGCVDWSSFRPLLLFGEFQPHLRSQYSEQYNLTLERQLTKDMILRVGYVGTQAHRLLASHELNPGNQQTCLDIISLANANPTKVLSFAGGPQATCGPFGSDSGYFIVPNTSIPQGFHLPYGPNGPSVVTNSGPNGITLVGTRPFSSPFCQPLTGVGCPADGVDVFSNIFAEDTMANSNYHALQASLERHFSQGLYFQLSYTYSKAIDQGASFENQLNTFDFRKSRGLSLVDARHRFVFSPYWELPIPKHEGFAGKAMNGWAVSGIVTYQSGFPIRVFSGDDTELNSSFFFEPANTVQITGPVQFLNPRKNNNFWFSSLNIADSALGTFGNAPHALCCGPAISNTDLAIEKHTPISERFNTEFRAEFFNAWNHTQFANPDGNFSDTTFGQILKTREGPRVIQFGLKLLF